MKRNSKVLNILMLIPNLDFGGAQNVMISQAVKLNKKHNVYIASFNLINNQYDGFNFIDLNVRGANTLFLKSFNLLLRCLKVREIKRNLKIDITISHLEGANLVNILTKKNDKAICYMHGSVIADRNIMPGILGIIRRKFLIRFILSKATKIISVSYEIKKELVSNFRANPKKIFTIYNFFDINKIIKMSHEEIETKNLKVWLKKNHIIGYHGRIATQKNPIFLLKCFHQIKKRNEYNNLKLIIVGDGPLKTHFIKRCNEYQLQVTDLTISEKFSQETDIVITGFVQNPFKYIKYLSVYTLVSLWEGFPLSLGEALTCNIPVVSFNCSTGPLEILSDYNLEIPTDYDVFIGKYGILINPNKNEQSLMENTCSAILKLIENHRLRESFISVAIERAKEFSEDIHFKKLEELFS